ncbi:Multiple organellar RNA editing factor 1, mitochondrial [Linum perenne]
MALHFLRLRRAVTSLSAAHRSLSSSITPLPTQSAPRLLPYASPVSSSPNFSFAQSRGFTGSRVSLAQDRKYKLYKEGDEITEDTVLFEGCDFNHWLITVDFPKDPAPSPEEMVATYERICAQGLGISIEEAKQKMYACSTTTYQGFQAIMTEEQSEKFKDVPGVVFVLPDSYIDPINKEYGGKALVPWKFFDMIVSYMRRMKLVLFIALIVLSYLIEHLRLEITCCLLQETSMKME